ncbi:uncharacterized protein LOC132639150 [Lycium barbarum]|uniref:uncharacterized protein LOC132639150 n=1 Tax=Lycium barbarum TaxID=112863 RepID=UPI00293EFB39|nr:uncharacterized protein LOC132639150 [Lycium barbarum]
MASSSPTSPENTTPATPSSTENTTPVTLVLPLQPPSISNIKNFVPLELTYLNYLTWKKVFKPFLRSQNLLNLVEGSVPCPELTHPQYTLWIQCDTTAHSWINATLSPSILDTLLNYNCETSHQAWSMLEKLFLDHVSSSMIHLKNKFQNFKKGSLSMEEYLQQLHSLSSALSAIGKPISDEDLVAQTLQGLPPSYRTFVSGLNANRPFPSFFALRPRLLTEEEHIKAISSDDSQQSVALFIAAKNTNDAGRFIQQNQGRGSNQNRGRGRFHNKNRGRESGHNNYHTNFNNSTRVDPSILGPPPTPNATKSMTQCHRFVFTTIIQLWNVAIALTILLFHKIFPKVWQR